jgi:hypothetical protein
MIPATSSRSRASSLGSSLRQSTSTRDGSSRWAAGSWAKIAEAFPEAFVLDVTATPERLEGRGLAMRSTRWWSGPASPISSIWDSWRVRPPMRANRQIFSGVSIGNGNYDVAQIAAIMSRSAIVGDAVEHRSAKVGTKKYCWRHTDPPGAWPSRADGRLARYGKLATRCRAPRCPSIAGGTAVLLPSMVYSRSE